MMHINAHKSIFSLSTPSLWHQSSWAGVWFGEKQRGWIVTFKLMIPVEWQWLGFLLLNDFSQTLLLSQMTKTADQKWLSFEYWLLVTDESVEWIEWIDLILLRKKVHFNLFIVLVLFLDCLRFLYDCIPVSILETITTVSDSSTLQTIVPQYW